MAKRRSREEEKHQVALVAWFRRQFPAYSNLLTIASIGENVGAIRMNRLKQMGLTPGFPDLMLMVPRYSSDEVIHGLFIEMKSKNGKVSMHQHEIHQSLRVNNYMVEVCYSWCDARDTIKDYLKRDSSH